MQKTIKQAFSVIVVCLMSLGLYVAAAAQTIGDETQTFPSRLVVGTSSDQNPTVIESTVQPVLPVKKQKRAALLPVKPAKVYSAADLARLASEAARKYNIPEMLFFMLIRQESGWRIGITSPKGAKGLTQLMPGTAVRFGLIVNALLDERVIPEKNLDAGARYFRFLLDTFGNNYALALAGYNAGEGAVFKYNYQIPPYAETRNYVAVICTTAFGSVQPCLSSGSLSRQTSLVAKTSMVSPVQKKQRRQQQNLPVVASTADNSLVDNEQSVKPLRINTSVFQAKPTPVRETADASGTTVARAIQQ